MIDASHPELNIDIRQVRAVALASGIVIIGVMLPTQKLTLDYALRASFDASANQVRLQSLQPFGERLMPERIELDSSMFFGKPYVITAALADTYLALLLRLHREAIENGEVPAVQPQEVSRFEKR